MRNIKQGLGLLALSALALGSIGAGTASAATGHPAGHPATTRAQWRAAIGGVRAPRSGCFSAAYPQLRWRAVRCTAAPRVPLAPAGVPGPARSAAHRGADTVGDGTDYSAQVSGLISKGVGTFTGVSSSISEKGQVDGSGSQVANVFSLQLNSEFFASPACSGSADPSDCQGWQQFVYTANGGGTGDIFMQYWLIDYDAVCPSGWYSYLTDCYTNSNAVSVSAVTAKQLASVRLTGTASSGARDTVSLSVGSGKAHLVSGPDSKVDLAGYWNTTEWGVYGDGGGSGATFGASNSLEAVTTLTATSTASPTCVSEGFTGETNNLTLASTPALGTETSPTMGSRQTDASPGTASCARAG